MPANLSPVAAARLVLPTPPLPLNNKILINVLYPNGALGLLGPSTVRLLNISSPAPSGSVRDDADTGAGRHKCLLCSLGAALAVAQATTCDTCADGGTRRHFPPKWPLR